MAINNVGYINDINIKEKLAILNNSSNMGIKEISTIQSKSNEIESAVPKFNNEKEASNNIFSHNRHIALYAYAHGEDKEEPKTAYEALKDRNENTKSIDEKMQDVEKKLKGESDAFKKDEDKKIKKELTKAEEQKVKELKERDAEVQTHERAHKALGGALAAAPAYEYETGPDGKRYAVNGHVDIDISEGRDAHDTIAKMETVQRAALAPKEPSSADLNIAAKAKAKADKARAELKEEAKVKDLEKKDGHVSHEHKNVKNKKSADTHIKENATNHK